MRYLSLAGAFAGAIPPSFQAHAREPDGAALVPLLTEDPFVQQCVGRKGGGVVVRIEQTYIERLPELMERLEKRMREGGVADAVAFETFEDAMERDCSSPPITGGNGSIQPRAIISLTVLKDGESEELDSARIVVWSGGACYTARISQARFVENCRPANVALALHEPSTSSLKGTPIFEEPRTDQRAGRTRSTHDLDPVLAAPLRAGVRVIPFILHGHGDTTGGIISEVVFDYEASDGVWAGLNAGFAAPAGETNIAGIVNFHVGYSGRRVGAAVGGGLAAGNSDVGDLDSAVAFFNYEGRFRFGRLDGTHVRLNVAMFILPLYANLSALFRIRRAQRPVWVSADYESVIVLGGAALLGARVTVPTQGGSGAHFVQAGVGVAYRIGADVGPAMGLSYEHRWSPQRRSRSHRRH